MNITYSNITDNVINLEMDETVSKLIISYGTKLENNFILENLNTKVIEIPKQDLELKTLKNTYFKIKIDQIETSLYLLDVINNKEVLLYNANKLKQELDNLNYYNNIFESLDQKKDFLTANDVFYNYINFLEKKLNANNLSKVINR